VTRFIVNASVLAGLALGCGGLAANDDGGVGDGGPHADGSTTGDGGGDAGWTPCSSPDGYMVCGGANNCNANTACAQYCASTGTELEPCGNYTVGTSSSYECDNAPCPDGALCLLIDGTAPTDVPLAGQCVADEIGQLFHLNGADSRLLYMDYSFYDGSPLPSPTACPNVTGLTLCGGACGNTCPSDAIHTCVGRSPKHPYSLCLATNGGGFGCTTSDQSACKTYGTNNGLSVGCLFFTDASASQPNGDAHGICIDQPTCNAAAQG
jgi:hypothetical protein